MNPRRRLVARPLVVLAVLSLIAASPPARAAEAAGPAPALRVHLVIHRSAGGDESAQPYSFLVGEKRAKVRVEQHVPVPAGGGQGEDGAPRAAYRYQDVGTVIDCTREALDDGSFRLILALRSSSLTAGPREASAASPWQRWAAAEGLPTVRSFAVEVEAVLRDGESTRVLAATDPVTGESVEVELRIEVL